MLTYFPNYFAKRAIWVYVALLLLIPIIFGYPMKFYYWIFGLIEVLGFFYFSNTLSIKWSKLNGKILEKKLFATSAWIRIIYVVVSYFFYTAANGVPFEFGSADAYWYHDMGIMGADILYGKDIHPSAFFGGVDLTDIGYPIWLAIVYALTGKSILLSRCIKALISAWTVVLMYKIARRNFGDNVGRLTGIFCMLMPNFIYYCGITLKETEMLFLVVLFIEKADYIFHWKTARFSDLLFLLLIGISTYFFRNVLCALLFISYAATVVFSSNKLKSGAKWTIEVFILLIFGLIIVYNSSSSILGKSTVSTLLVDQKTNMQWRSIREGGNSFAKQASAAVFAPLICTIPFPTMSNINYQEAQQMIHGGNFVKNITSYFTILALLLLLINGKWKGHVLPIAFTAGYLFVLVFSQFAQSERFHIPSVPFELMFAAYGISVLKRKHIDWFQIWLAFIFVANLAWAWFKLRGRGM